MERKFSISEAIILLGRISLVEEDINRLISQCAGSGYESVNAVWDILPHKECVAVTSHATADITFDSCHLAEAMLGIICRAADLNEPETARKAEEIFVLLRKIQEEINDRE